MSTIHAQAGSSEVGGEQLRATGSGGVLSGHVLYPLFCIPLRGSPTSTLAFSTFALILARAIDHRALTFHCLFDLVDGDSSLSAPHPTLAWSASRAGAVSPLLAVPFHRGGRHFGFEVYSRKERRTLPRLQ